MRRITLISTLCICLHLLPGTAAADNGGGDWTWPTRGPVITRYLNGSDPYAAGQHRGVDIAARAGTPVLAATSGTITFAGVAGSSGLTLAERTADGRLDLSYLHLGSARARRGDAVAAGDLLGTVGTSGRRSAEAPHLHFGVREAGSHTAYRDPLDFLPPPPAGGAPDPEPVPVPVAAPAATQVAPAPVAVPAAEAQPVPGGHPTPVAPALPGLPAPSLAPSHGSAPAIPMVSPVTRHAVPAHRPAILAHRFGPAPATRPALPSGPTRRPGSPHTGSTAPTPLSGPAAQESPSSAGATGSADRARASGSRHGIDVGWLLACLGLIVAATALGHPDTTRKLTVRGRSRIVAMLRPAGRGG